MSESDVNDLIRKDTTHILDKCRILPNPIRRIIHIKYKGQYYSQKYKDLLTRLEQNNVIVYKDFLYLINDTDYLSYVRKTDELFNIVYSNYARGEKVFAKSTDMLTDMILHLWCLHFH
jgi:hypothetical protein